MPVCEDPRGEMFCPNHGSAARAAALAKADRLEAEAARYDGGGMADLDAFQWAVEKRVGLRADARKWRELVKEAEDASAA